MKFEQQLALKSIPSWAIYYMNYKKLKAVLYTCANDSTSGQEQPTKGGKFGGPQLF